METDTVDQLDRQLVHCLSVDGRATFSQVAGILEVSDQTVARRYRRMRALGLVRVVGVPTPQSEGFVSRYLRIRCVPGSGEAIAAALSGRADTAWVQLLSGDTEVMCSLRSNPTDRAESMLTRLPRSNRIVAVTLSTRLHMFTAGTHLGFLRVLPLDRVAPLELDSSRGDGGYVGPGELDRALFAALNHDGRTPYADLAAATGWSETTVRRRVDQLRKGGALRFELELDLPAFGFRSTAWLWLSVPLSRLAEVGAALAECPEITFAVATTGPANLAAAAVCRNEEELYELLTTRVGALPGVELVETAPVTRTLKRANPMVAPGVRAG